MVGLKLPVVVLGYSKLTIRVMVRANSPCFCRIRLEVMTQGMLLLILEQALVVVVA